MHRPTNSTKPRVPPDRWEGNAARNALTAFACATAGRPHLPKIGLCRLRPMPAECTGDECVTVCVQAEHRRPDHRRILQTAPSIEAGKPKCNRLFSATTECDAAALMEAEA